MEANFAALVFILLNIIKTAKPQSQISYLYSGTNGTGNFVKLNEAYEENLGNVSFYDQAISICLTGIWLLYEDEKYNMDGNSKVEYYFGRENDCKNLGSLQGKVTSVRYAGAPKDYTTDTLTLYEHTYFQGGEEYVITQSPSLSLNASSIILTGNGYWTIFDKTGYAGSSMCLSPKKPGTSTPVFFHDILADLQFPKGAIKSVKRGCTEAY